MTRLGWVLADSPLPVKRQCQLASVSRATVYSNRKPRMRDEMELLLCRLIDEEYTRHPFYGSRKMVRYLRIIGHVVNRKRVQRLMQTMGLAGMAPRPNTSKAHPEHKVYPYLLRGVPIVRANQVWSTDITYVRLAHGFAYLVAVIDWYSRKVLSWRISNSMEAVFCVDCLEDALRAHGTPEIFNSDQGSQFTSDAFTGVLKREGITISMDGRGRAFDNIFVERLWRSVKHEDIYLRGYGNMVELMIGLTAYMLFYNEERPHQSLGYSTPNEVYRTGIGGGAMIVDKFGGAIEEPSVERSGTEGSSIATTEAKAQSTTEAKAAARKEPKTEAPATSKATSKPGQRRPAACEAETTA